MHFFSFSVPLLLFFSTGSNSTDCEGAHDKFRKEQGQSNSSELHKIIYGLEESDYNQFGSWGNFQQKSSTDINGTVKLTSNGNSGNAERKCEMKGVDGSQPSCEGSLVDIIDNDSAAADYAPTLYSTNFGLHSTSGAIQYHRNEELHQFHQYNPSQLIPSPTSVYINKSHYLHGSIDHSSMINYYQPGLNDTYKSIPTPNSRWKRNPFLLQQAIARPQILSFTSVVRLTAMIALISSAVGYYLHTQLLTAGLTFSKHWFLLKEFVLYMLGTALWPGIVLTGLVVHSTRMRTSSARSNSIHYWYDNHDYAHDTNKKENDINHAVRLFVHSVCISYPILYLLEVACTTIGRLAILKFTQPELFGLIPTVPIYFLPWFFSHSDGSGGSRSDDWIPVRDAAAEMMFSDIPSADIGTHRLSQSTQWWMWILNDCILMPLIEELYKFALIRKALRRRIHSNQKQQQQQQQQQTKQSQQAQEQQSSESPPLMSAEVPVPIRDIGSNFEIGTASIAAPIATSAQNDINNDNSYDNGIFTTAAAAATTTTVNTRHVLLSAFSIALGLKLSDNLRRISVLMVEQVRYSCQKEGTSAAWTKDAQARRQEVLWYAVAKSLFPVSELCAFSISIGTIKRQTEGNSSTWWSMWREFFAAVVLRSAAHFMGSSPIYAFNPTAPWRELQLPVLCSRPSAMMAAVFRRIKLPYDSFSSSSSSSSSSSGRSVSPNAGTVPGTAGRRATSSVRAKSGIENESSVTGGSSGGGGGDGQRINVHYGGNQDTNAAGAAAAEVGTARATETASDSVGGGGGGGVTNIWDQWWRQFSFLSLSPLLNGCAQSYLQLILQSSTSAVWYLYLVGHFLGQLRQYYAIMVCSHQHDSTQHPFF